MTDHLTDPADPRLAWHVRLLLGGYPPWWRLRYNDEMRDTVLAMRDAGHWRAGDGRDLLRGLIEAWFNPALVPSGDPATDGTRRLIPRTAWGLLLFVLAGTGFAKAIDDPAISTATTAHPAIAACLDVLVVDAGVVAVVMAVCAIPYLHAIIRRDGRRAWRLLAPLVAVPISTAVWALALAIAKNVADGTPVHRASHVVAFLALSGVTVIGGACSTAAFLRVTTTAPESRGVAVARRVAMIAVGALTAISVLAVTGWVIAVAVEASHLLHGDNGFLATATLPSLGLALVGLVGSAAMCLSGGLEAFRSRSGPQAQAG